MNCRSVVAGILLILLGLEILPCSYLEPVTLSAAGSRGFACSIEPLQVCDHGDSFLGVLFDLPVLLPGPPSLFPSSETLSLVQQAVAFVPDGFLPAIDHPPQLRA
jgi:hypothetical protein